MKKCISSLLCAVMLMASVTVNAGVVGHIYKTDIKAYENYMQIPSYNCGGTTVVFVRDLENYGYDVFWDSAARKVFVSKKQHLPWSPIVPVYEGDDSVGTVLFDVYSTDIRTYFENKEIKSYNIGGKTAINFRDLDAGKNLKFDSATRRATIFSKNISLTAKKINHIDYMYEILECMGKLDYSLEKAAKLIKEGKSDKKLSERIKSEFEVFRELRDELQSYTEPDAFSESTMEIWWSVVNEELAAELVMNSEDFDVGKFERYMLDSYQQRNNALLLLASEF